jgi:putative transposase
MKRSRFSEEHIVYAIRQAESGTPVGDLCRKVGVSEATLEFQNEEGARTEGLDHSPSPQ